jgi:hypothetical protein
MNESRMTFESKNALNLRVGEWVEVQSQAEILATLDDTQSVGGLPFMPEMMRYCGRRFQVQWSAHKTADTIELFTIRRMENAVHLKELRCDGMSHGGCQAGCLIFWKECWLKRVQAPPQPVSQSESTANGERKSCPDALTRLSEGTKGSSGNNGETCYRCQATEMLKATSEVRRRDRWNPLFYLRDLTSGNVKPLEFIRFGLMAALNAFLQRWFNCRYPYVRGLSGEKTPSCELSLQPGELVQVRSKKEIVRTLNKQNRNRGMWFDVEMVPYCRNGNHRVLRRVEKIINEKTGEMMSLKNPCIILEGLTCGGNYSSQRMFSRRHDYLYWREIWLERVGKTNGERSSSRRLTPSAERAGQHSIS